MAKRVKKCPHCSSSQNIESFYKNKAAHDGLSSWCRLCNKGYRDKNKQRSKEYRNHNKDKAFEYRQVHKKKMREYFRVYRKNNLEKVKTWQREWHQRNREYLKTRRKERILNDPRFHLDCHLSTLIYQALRRFKAGRHWEKLVGYTLDDLIIHLEAKFNKNMSWDNYGSYWHLDHVKPKSWFQYKTAEDIEFKECWSLNNLQPLQADLNLRKNNHYIG